MSKLSLDLQWGASWQQDNRYYCVLFIKKDYMNTRGFDEFLKTTFGENFGGWRYDKQRHGIEIWFRNKEDMLTFKLLNYNNSMDLS